jgi:hypothetical protein
MPAINCAKMIIFFGNPQGSFPASPSQSELATLGNSLTGLISEVNQAVIGSQEFAERTNILQKIDTTPALSVPRAATLPQGLMNVNNSEKNDELLRRRCGFAFLFALN